jgi:hypothetical protein
MLQYLIEIFLLTNHATDVRGHVQQVTSEPLSIIDEVLSSWSLPKFHSWTYRGSTGSNAPRHRKTLNTSHYDLKDQPSVTMLVTLYELVPRDLQKEL